MSTETKKQSREFVKQFELKNVQETKITVWKLFENNLIVSPEISTLTSEKSIFLLTKQCI